MFRIVKMINLTIRIIEVKYRVVRFIMFSWEDEFKDGLVSKDIVTMTKIAYFIIFARERKCVHSFSLVKNKNKIFECGIT